MEQKLLEDLVHEMIATRGFDGLYIVANYKAQTEDTVMGENPGKSFEVAIPVAMYLMTFDSFGGQGDQFMKFGIQVNDSLSLAISVREFKNEVVDNERAGPMLEASRPREQDLLYFPFNKRLYSITFVEHEMPLYQSGARQFWEMRAELHTYSNESYNTGIPEIDNQEIEHAIPKRKNVENSDDFAEGYEDVTASDNAELNRRGKDFIDDMEMMFDEE